MKLPFTGRGGPDIERLKKGLILLSGLTVLAGFAGGYLGYLADKDARDKEADLAKRIAVREERDENLRRAQSATGPDSSSGIQAIRRFQESLDRLAANHQVKVTAFQSSTSLAPMKSSFGISQAPGWGMAAVDVTLTGSSRGVFTFLRELAYSDSPFEIEKAFFEPSLPSPNGGTQVAVALNLKVFAKEQKG